MTRRQIGGGTELWLGQETEKHTEKRTEKHEAFGGGRLWIGQHDGDQDLLVFDPSEADPHADVLSLYSLTQHRIRSFPRATVLTRIPALTDELGRARAKRDYARRASLRITHEQALAAARIERRNRQRSGVIAAHRRYIESLGLEYQGERETPADHRPGRRTKCHACGIALDDFAGAVCGICNRVLCSCGACACGYPVHSH